MGDITLSKLKCFLVIGLILTLFSCASSSSLNGTYYLYEEGIRDANSFIEIKNGKWSDSDGLNGEYEINNQTIHFYSEVFGSTELILSGEINDGVLRIKILNIESVYAKDGALPELNINLDFMSIGDFSLEDTHLTIIVNYQMTTFNLGDQLQLMTGAKLKVYSDASKHNLVEDYSNLNLSKNNNDFYVDIIDINHNVTVKSYHLSIIKNVPYTIVFKDSDNQELDSIQIFRNEFVQDSPFSLVSSPEGYIFAGWMYYTYDAWGQQVEHRIDDLSTFVINQDYILYPYFSEGTYKVFLAELNEELEIKYNDSFTLPIMSKVGYIFDGWMDQAERRITDRFGNAIQPFKYGDDVVFIPIWIAQDYSVSIFNSNPNGGRLSYEGILVGKYGSSQSISAYANNGFNFIGWFIDGELFSEDGVIYFVITDVSIQYEARFQIIQYNITYHLDGGINAPENTALDYNVESDAIRLFSPEREFYTFDGWYKDSEFKQAISIINKGSTGHLNLYAKFTPTLYTITYTLYGGNNPITNPKYYTVLNEFSLSNPSKVGFTFDGWYTDTSFIHPAQTTIQKNSSGNLYFYAKWVANDYQLEYHLSGGINHPDNPSVVTPLTQFVLNIPIREGYIFNGWYLNETYSNKITQIQNIYQDTDLYAKWTPISYDITLYTADTGSSYRVRFHENGGTPIINDKIVTVNDRLNFPTVPTKDGYIFVGWYRDKELTQRFDFTPKNDLSQDLDLYAKYIEKPNGTHVTTNSFTYMSGNSYFVVPLFSGNATISASGWSLPSNNHVTRLEFGGTMQTNGSSFTVKLEAGRVYYISASYRSNITNAITFANNLSITVSKPTITSGGNAANQTQSITYGEMFELPVPDQKFALFQGWYTEPDAQGIQLTDDEGKSLQTWDISSSVIIYAYFISTKYTITYDLQHDEINHSDNLLEYDQDTYGLIMHPDKPYYTFDGWYLDSSLTKDVLYYQKLDGDVTLYPKFTPIIYTIDYELNGGNNSTKNPIQYNVESRFTLETPARIGYSFVGWYTDLEMNDPFNPIFEGLYNHNLVLYAKWQSIQYTITYELNGGINDSEPLIRYDIEDSEQIKEPSKIGYTFIGWFKDSQFTEIINSISPGQHGDLVLHAKWELTQFQVTYNMYGGTNHINNPNYITILDDSHLLERPSLEGYQFIGWYLDVDFLEPITVIPPSSHRTYSLYAKFEPYQYVLSFETNGGSIISERTLSTDEPLDLVTPQKDYFSLEGWYLDEALTIRSTYDVMPASNLKLYAKWIDYSITIVYDAQKKSVKETGTISAGDFSAIAIDTDGDEYSVDVQIVSGIQTATSRLVIKLNAIGKYDITTSVMLQNIVVYGTPSITYDQTIKSISIFDEVDVDTFRFVFKDTEGNLLESAEITHHSGTYLPGNQVTFKVIVYDHVGNSKELITQSIALYGDPVITARDAYMPVGSNINASSFNANAKDSFNKSLVINLQQVTYKVTVDPQNGSSVSTMNVAHNSFLNRFSVPYKQGYKFVGWFNIVDGKMVRYDFSKPVTSDLNIIASWTVLGYILHYNKNYSSGTLYSTGITTIDFYSEYDGLHTFTLNYSNLTLGNFYLVDKDGKTLSSTGSYTYGSDSRSISYYLKANEQYYISVNNQNKNGNYTVSVNYDIPSTNQLNERLYRIFATDSLGNKTTIYQTLYLYDKPTIEVNGISDYKVDDVITLESLGVSAKDSFGYTIEDENLTLSIVGGTQVAGGVITYLVSAKDAAKQVVTKEILVKIYGEPTITYDNKQGIRADDIISLANYLDVEGLDSHHNRLSITARLKEGYTQIAGNFVIIIFEVTDSLGQTSSIETDLIPVYGQEDLWLSYSVLGVTEASINGSAEEFNAHAGGSFGDEGIRIYIVNADGSNAQHNTTVDIKICVEDIAGNKYYSDTISNIYLYDYMVTFVSNNDTNDTKVYISKNSKLSSVLPNPPLNGYYAFEGWYNDPLLEGDMLDGNTYPGQYENLTFYASYVLKVAIFLDKQVIVAFDFNDGITPILYQSVTTTKRMVYPDIPNRVGYRFLGWYTTITGGTAYVNPEKINNNVYLYARWETHPSSNINTYIKYETMSYDFINYTFKAYKTGEYALSFKGQLSIIDNSDNRTLYNKTSNANDYIDFIDLVADKSYTIRLRCDYVSIAYFKISELTSSTTTDYYRTGTRQIDYGVNLIEYLNSQYSAYAWYRSSSIIPYHKINETTVFIPSSTYIFDSTSKSFYFYGIFN